VRAAVRTPGTRRVTGRDDWVALETARWDRFTVDRAAAWFESARRDATQKAREPG
jgi:hypothetical protein